MTRPSPRHVNVYGQWLDITRDYTEDDARAMREAGRRYAERVNRRILDAIRGPVPAWEPPSARLQPIGNGDS